MPRARGQCPYQQGTLARRDIVDLDPAGVGEPAPAQLLGSGRPRRSTTIVTAQVVRFMAEGAP